MHTIAEDHLLPVIEQMLEQFPFEILGFHADNGSEYVNHRVARMLDKLRIEFTRSRPRHSNDNGLAETKNGAVVRKVFGYEHIAQRHAGRFNTFCVEYLNPFLNFHRPCLFATELADAKKPGRIKRVYRPKDAMTPLDKLQPARCGELLAQGRHARRAARSSPARSPTCRQPKNSTKRAQRCSGACRRARAEARNHRAAGAGRFAPGRAMDMWTMR